MARIPEEEIDRIKRETDLAVLVRSRGVELAQHGSKNLIGRCPFHDDNDPSFVVSPDKGLFHCLGCGVAGNVIQFVQKFDGVSFRHAFEILSDNKTAYAAPDSGHLKTASIPRLENPLNPYFDGGDLLDQVADYYHSRLRKTPDAIKYLELRGLNNNEAIDKFRLGFADRTLGLRLPNNNRQTGHLVRERLKRLGIMRDNGHEFFTGSLLVPVTNGDGHVAEIYGRKITRRIKKGMPVHQYLPGPHRGVWNIEALNEPDVILCEAPLDALTFWISGFKNVTFIYGAHGFTDELREALVAYRVKRVRIAYDADEAGNKAAVRDAARLAEHGIDSYRIKFPHGMDANEYALKVQPAAKSLGIAVQSAELMGERRHPDPPPPSRAHARASISSSLAAKKEEAASGCTLHQRGEYRFISFGDPAAGGTGREYRIGGLEKNNSLEVLKIALRLRRGETFHLDSFDLMQDGHRRRFIERAAEETGIEKDLIKSDLGKLLLALEREQEDRLAQAATPEDDVPDMTAHEREETVALLRAPDLIKRLDQAFDVYGLVGEESKRLAAYLACTSRLLDKPLAVIVQSTSAAGKTALMEAVLSMFPTEERVKYSAMTGQSLYYLGEQDLKHKILAIVEEEGAENASYALKLLQSEGELTIASTGKDPHTGRMETQEYHVEGPVMIFLTTTAIDIDEELQNRCLTLTVDESREQTERIHALQRKARTLEGLRLKKKKQRLLTLLRNAQRLLQPVDVVNPYADELTFTAERTRTRRDHEKYLTLIDTIALLHQHQRRRETDRESGEQSEFIRVTLSDIELANRLAPELLGRSLDELPPQTRCLLTHIKSLVREMCHAQECEQHLVLFSRKDLRERSGWTEYQVRVHLGKLEDLEYVQRRWGRQGKRCVYELLTDMDEPEHAWQIGLIDVTKLKGAKRGSITETKTSCIKKPTSGHFVENTPRSVSSSTLVAYG